MEQETIITENETGSRQLKRTLFWLWEFVCTEGLHEEAEDFLLSHKDADMPFDWL